MTLTLELFRNQGLADEEAFKKARAPVRGTPIVGGGAFEEKISHGHFYMERGSGRPIVFFPGLFGSIDNVAKLGLSLSERYRFIVSYLPVYDLPLSDCSLGTLAEYLHEFVKDLTLEDAVFIGSSMGGGTLLHYALKDYAATTALILCGSAGLSSLPMQEGFLRRKDPAFVRRMTQEVFFDPSTPSEKMHQEVYDAAQNYQAGSRIIRFARAATRDHLHRDLHKVRSPSLLIWGRHDAIVPVETGHLFNELLPNSSLHILENCGHVPTQEKPDEVAALIQQFLSKIDYR